MTKIVSDAELHRDGMSAGGGRLWPETRLEGGSRPVKRRGFRVVRWQRSAKRRQTGPARLQGRRIHLRRGLAKIAANSVPSGTGQASDFNAFSRSRLGLRRLETCRLVQSFGDGDFAAHTLGLSAEIQRVDDGACTISLQAEITSGDARTLWDTKPRCDDVLRLDSPGGTFAEAIKIAERLDRGSLATLQARSKCLSARALTSVAASLFEDIHLRRRPMHEQARLGFHAPFVIPPRGQAETAASRH